MTQQSVAKMKRILALLLAVFLTVTLPACSSRDKPTPKASEMTPEEIRAQIEDLYQASVAATAADGWEVSDSWTDCSDGPSRPRVNLLFAASRTAPLPGAPADLITHARTAWKERGHDVTVERDTNLTPPRWILSDPPYLTGSYPDGSYYTLDISESAIYFRAYSACVPGDIFQLTSPEPTP